MKNKKRLIGCSAAATAGICVACFVIFSASQLTNRSQLALQSPSAPILTDMPLPPTDTSTPIPPTATSVFTETPAPTDTLLVSTDTPIPAPTAPMVTANGNDNINLRAGPGTDYKIIGVLNPGDSAEIIGRNPDSTWWQINAASGPAWVFADVVQAENLTDLIPIAEAPPLPVIEQPPLTPTSIPTPPAPAAVCNCSGDTYKCGDFGTHAAAQSCFDYCVSQGQGDIHKLDKDQDNIACENLP